MSKIDLSIDKRSISPTEQSKSNQFQSTTKKTNKNIQYRNNIYDLDFVKFENLRNLTKDEFIHKSRKSNTSSFKGSDASNLETGLTKQKEKLAQTFLVPFFEAVKKSGMSKPFLISFKGSEQQVAEASLLERLNNVQSREDFVAVRDEINKMPNGEEKKALVEAYLKAYNEWSKAPQRPDIRMEYNLDEIQFKELTDDEFKAMKLQVEAVINNNAILKEKLNGVDLTKESIQVLKNVIENYSEWLDKNNSKYNQYFVNEVKSIINYSENLESVNSRIYVMKCIKENCSEWLDKNNPKYNKIFADMIGRIINNSYTLKSAKARTDVMKSIKDNCSEWIDPNNPKYNQKFADEIGKIISYSYTLESAQAKTEVMKFIKENCSEWFDPNNSKYNKILVNMVAEIINYSESLEYANSRIDVMKCIKENCSEWLDKNNSKYNKNFVDVVGKIISYSETPESAKAGIEVMKSIKENCSEWLDKDNSKYNKNFVDDVGCIIYNSDTLQRYKAKSDIMKCIKENCSEWLDKNNSKYSKIFADEVGNIIYNTNTSERAKVKVDMIKYINENCSEWLDKNNSKYSKSFADKVGSIVYNSDAQESVKAGIEVMKCIKENCSEWLDKNNPEYNQSFVDEVGSIIYNSESLQRAKARIDVMKCIKDNYSELLDKNNPKYNKFFADKIGEIIKFSNNKYSVCIIKAIIDNPKLLENKNFVDKIDMILYYSYTPENVNFTIELIENYEKLGISGNHIPVLIINNECITSKDIQVLNNALGEEKVAKLSESDILLACKIPNLANKNSINEIPATEKKELIRSLVDCNDGMFGISDELAKDFPLIPRNKEQYCELLPSLVRSIGVETKQLKAEQIAKFNKSLEHLSDNIAKISDEEFNNLKISQEFSKDDFINVVLDKVKDLSVSERQKVYDYFGFELHHKKNTKYNTQDGFTITGYPQNLNDDKNLVQIEDFKTKAVVESLRRDVVKFSENNKIKTNNKDIDIFLNEVADALPEIRTMIGRKQHFTHDFDVMQHSLKVMQKISQDPQFKTLNESDKRLMMIASLLHDVTKAEGISDKTHATESSLDTYFIAQKFNLSRDEQTKLNSLIKNHEWLSFVNSSNTFRIREKRMQDVAFDLQYDNLFEMSLMFTHADLKAVKKSDLFNDTTEGSTRVELNGKVRSYGESADIYATKIRENIAELKTSRPILPVTKIPKSDRINQAITKVNSDGSTNIKGVYKDEAGLVIIKFNEVEDWEAIGFPKGSKSNGILADYKTRENGPIETANTGNIKFFAHGLDYANQLANFNVFSLPNNDALLSLSYAERPESKYRFFRPQGVLLDVDTQYIHGGGDTDSGSGYRKNIQDFKDNYILGGEREVDRIYISNLVKEATGMNDIEYVKFVEDNKNKAMTEIEPEETREKIIKAFATINSNTRKGNREYNEIYGSNPNPPMGVFAYSVDYSEHIDNPIEFLNRTTISDNEKVCGPYIKSVAERTEFLKQYALENNLPFYIFGD